MAIEFDAPIHWRLRKIRYTLSGEICPSCQAKLFPPKDICPNCGEKAQHLYQFSGKGEVYSYTTIFDPPAGFEEQAPYTVALIKLEEGPLITAQLTDLDEKPWIGMPVEMVTRKLKDSNGTGVVVYGYKFRPTLKIGTNGKDY